MHTDKLNDIVNKHNDTYHRNNKMKPVYVTSSTYITFGMKNNDKDSKFKVGDQVRISKYKSTLLKVTFQIVLKRFYD